MATFQLQYNGITINRSANYRVQEISGLFDTDLRLSMDNLTGGDGGNVWAENYSMRRISWIGVVKGNTDSEFFTAVNELVNAFKKTNEALPLVVTLWNGSSRTIMAKVLKMPEIVLDNKAKNVAYYRLSLICEDPLYESTSESSQSVGLITGAGGAIPTAVPMSLASGVGGSVVINNTGNEDIYPTFEILGPALNATIENDTTDVQFQIQTQIFAAETVTVEKSTAGLSVTSNLNGDYFPYFSGSAIKLIPGNNTIKFSASGYSSSALLTIRYSIKSITPI